MHVCLTPIFSVFFAALLSACSLSALGAGIERPLASDEYLNQNWTTDDGLLHTGINQIIQDHTGFLWLATAGGLGRFDGHAFKNFIPPESMQKGGYNIRGLTETKSGTLLLLIARGQILQFQGNTFSLHPMSVALMGKAWADIFADREGAIWVGATDGTLVRWQDGHATVFGQADGIDRRTPRFSFATDESGRTWIGTGAFIGYYSNGKLVGYHEPIGHVISLAGSHAGGLWVIADGQLARLNNGQYSIVLADPPWLRAEASIRCLFEDKRGYLWIGATHRGLFRYGDGTCARIPYSFDSVNHVTEDTEGDIWVGTDGDGLSILKPKYFRRYDVSAGFRENLSSSICEDAAGDIWFANGKGGLWRKHDEQISQVSPIEAYALCTQKGGLIWVGTSEGVYHFKYDDPASMTKASAGVRVGRIVYCAQNGDVWCAGVKSELGVYRGGTYLSYTDDESVARNHVSAIGEDRQGNIWIGTGLGSLFVTQGARLVRSTLSANATAGAPIHALWADQDNGLWIGTSNGLILQTAVGSQRFDESNGLPDSMIFQIMEDDTGNVWFGSRRGFFYISKKQLAGLASGALSHIFARTFGKDEGLPGISPLTTGQPTAWKDHLGTLWMATHQGVIAISPSLFAKPGPPPPVLIDDIQVDDKAIAVSPKIEIPPGNHRVEFHFCAISFSAPSKVRLRHRLEGIDPGWVDTDIARSASYAGLSPGLYQLKVEARNDGEPWLDHGTKLAVLVLPAWWQTPWFRALELLALVAFVAIVVRSWSEIKLRQRLERLERAHALEKERARIARDVHDELGSSVTGLRLLVNRLKEDTGAREHNDVVEQLSGRTQRLAFDLERVVWSVSPKNSRLDQLVTFVGRFAQNFVRGTSIECSILRTTTPPSLALSPEFQHHILAVTKEAINNVIKHSKATRVVIETDFKDNSLELTISDDGLGFIPSAAEHTERNGLNNMRSRIAEIGGQIDISSRPNGGTKIKICAPIPCLRS